MKQLTIIITAIAAFFTASSFTVSNPLPASVTDNENVRFVFNRDFATATAVTWKEKEGIYVASFSNNGTNSQVAYDSDGQLVGSSSSVYRSELPAEVLSAIAKKYPDCTIGSHATKIVLNNETSYHVTLATETSLTDAVVAPDLSITAEHKQKLQKD